MLPIILSDRLRGELEGVSLEPGYVLIKSYSENREMVEAVRGGCRRRAAA